jgi:hypothetical protein
MPECLTVQAANCCHVVRLNQENTYFLCFESGQEVSESSEDCCRFSLIESQKRVRRREETKSSEELICEKK